MNRTVGALARAWGATFWTSAALLAYVYAGYPALVWAAAARRSPRRPPPPPAEELPAVSVVTVAHNEAARIGRRLDNLLALDYPRDRLEIILASDGSTDGTVELARAREPAGVVVMAFELRRGKPAVLSDVVPKARGEIVVLADARQRFEAGALRALVAPFADPRVGAVSGELMLAPAREGTTVATGVGAYWRYEKLIRRSESRLDSTVGATGAIYAIRRDLFEPVPPDTILDDVLIPLRITRRGYRVLFEPAARAWDDVAERAGHEFARKARTLAGNFQLFARERWTLSPWENRLWLQTLSHKALRLTTPLLHVLLLAASVARPRRLLGRAAVAGHVAFFAAAVAGGVQRRRHEPSRLLALPYVVCLLNAATVAGFVRFLTGRQRATWDRPRD